MPNEDGSLAQVRRRSFGLIQLEKKVIALTVAGYSSEESAERIGISKQAIRQHLVNIFDKLEVTNRLELVLFAVYHQIIDLVQLSPPA